MPKTPTLRSFVIQSLGAMKRISQKEIGVRAGMDSDQVSYHLRKEGRIDDATFEQLLAGVGGTPEEVEVGTACYEALTALGSGALPPSHRAEIEREVLAVSRAFREALTQAALWSLSAPPRDEYPRPGDVEPARWQARELLSILKKEGTAGQWSAVVRASTRLQTWACAEWAAEESIQAASRDLKEAWAWACLGVEIAELVPGPEGWTNRIKGFTGAHLANVLKAKGELKAADAAFGPARKLWLAGSDPDQILDPGKLLNLEAVLRRTQRRFDDALRLQKEALKVSRSPAQTVISTGFTLEVMGEYERAVEALLEAAPLVEQEGDPRLSYMRRFNLAVNYTHLSLYTKAVELVEQVQQLVLDRGDEVESIRVTWLRGRISAGLGRPEEALRLLELAQGDFAARDMWYDVALAFMEVGALLLDAGRPAKVRAMIPGIVKEFQARDVHREALVALRLFQEATELETATAEMARSVLRFLFQARHDQGLRFCS
ncbi:MAG: tetratricopeptide repeat protein [Acidobacteriota bacterium]